MNRHESFYINKIAEILREKFPDEFFITEVYTPYGTQSLKDKSGRPDILRINKQGGITVIEVKKLSHPSISKWQVIGELLFYKFLTDTQLFHDNDEYKWLEILITNGMADQEAIDSIENRHKKEGRLVDRTALILCEGSIDQVKYNETIWHMHTYIREMEILNLDILYLEETQPNIFNLKLLDNWFLEEE